MAVVDMQKISICAHRSNRKAILETLQSMGIMQVVIDDLDDPELMKMDTADARARFEKNADLADQATGDCRTGHVCSGESRIAFGILREEAD